MFAIDETYVKLGLVLDTDPVSLGIVAIIDDIDDKLKNETDQGKISEMKVVKNYLYKLRETRKNTQKVVLE